MEKLVRIFFWGLAISFLGSLPLGTMNVTVTHISLQQGIHNGYSFAWGSMIVEVIIVRIALEAMSWLLKQHKIFRVLEYITTSLVFFLAIGSFIAAYNMSGFSSPLPVQSLTPFWTGVVLSATNPLHIPFWMGWSTVLMNKNILEPSLKQYNWYVTGIGIGTMLGFMIFIYGGSYFVEQIIRHQQVMNYAIGTILLVTAIIQIRKIRTEPVLIRYNKSK